ncbi:hypothetical protein EJ06DRAFT_282217 [Trichodelitschia bisporula]|uniref:alpha-galactosidase n=1 Tax=Trichodelitschia bisporula TaxID=703511 RepID=A0A6G1I5F6_9PEZI|nr:hypothetical protein EJ06DRAFT_282217 [Trichodelitschia bisporula]
MVQLSLFALLFAGTALADTNARNISASADARNVTSAWFPSSRRIWHPPVDTKFQIVLSGVLEVDANTVLSPNVDAYDIDLWETPPETIKQLHRMGKKVICYFSAGTSEDWRPDFKRFRTSEMGAPLPMWPGEKWLDVRSRNVMNIMKDRIKLASRRGCDGIDPDNMDGYDNEKGGGFTRQLSKLDAIVYLRKLAREARRYNMAIGLKNAQAILKQVDNEIQFAVNEECVQMEECEDYKSFVSPTFSTGKPVLHIEYVNARLAPHMPAGVEIFSFMFPNATQNFLRRKLCLAEERRYGTKMARSTVIKQMSLGGWVMYCDGTTATTRTLASKKRPGEKAKNRNVRVAKGNLDSSVPDPDSAVPEAESAYDADAVYEAESAHEAEVTIEGHETVPGEFDDDDDVDVSDIPDAAELARTDGPKKGAAKDRRGPGERKGVGEVTPLDSTGGQPWTA